MPIQSLTFIWLFKYYPYVDKWVIDNIQKTTASRRCLEGGWNNGSFSDLSTCFLKNVEVPRPVWQVSLMLCKLFQTWEYDHRSCCNKPSYPTMTTVPDGVTEAKHNQVLWTSMQTHRQSRNFALFFLSKGWQDDYQSWCFEFLVWNTVDRTCRKKLLFKLIIIQNNLVFFFFVLFRVLCFDWSLLWTVYGYSFKYSVTQFLKSG